MFTNIEAMKIQSLSNELSLGKETTNILVVAFSFEINSLQ